MDKNCKLKSHVTEDFLNQTKVDASLWSEGMKTQFQEELIGFGYKWEGDSEDYFYAGWYFLQGKGLYYHKDADYEKGFFKTLLLKEITWDDIFGAVNESVKLDTDNSISEPPSLQSPESLVGLKVSEDTSNKPFKSTGGSSKYYEVVLPDWLLDKQKENGYIMVEDLAEIMFNNDFNYTNIFKAQKRMFDLQNGGGKVGNTLEYDANKCKYYVDKQVEVFNRK